MKSSSYSAWQRDFERWRKTGQATPAGSPAWNSAILLELLIHMFKDSCRRKRKSTCLIVREYYDGRARAFMFSARAVKSHLSNQ